MTDLYLGVDAGNTKTDAMVCLPTGQVVGAGRAGCGDIYGAVTPRAAVDAVLTAVERALSQAGARRDRIAGAALRLAGVDWPEDREFWSVTLAEHWSPAFPRSILNDGYAAIRCGVPSGVGVAVIGGTAAAIAARGPDGTLWDMGWWGQHAMGAIGLAQEALRAVFLAELEEAPATGLTAALLEFYGRESVRDLNHWFTRRVGAASSSDRARCAPVVTGTASAGDPVAEALVREQGRRFARYAGVAARRVGLAEAGRPIDVVLSGSVLAARASPVTAALLDALAERLPAAVTHRPLVPVVAGSVLDALAEGGVRLEPRTVERLGASLRAVRPAQE